LIKALPVFDLRTDAAITFGNALTNVASTNVKVLVSVTPFSRGSLTIGTSCPPSSCMIYMSRCESKTPAASESDPKATFGQPSSIGLSVALMRVEQLVKTNGSD
jgi:hypothetical protein